MNRKILVVEDEKEIRDIIVREIKEELGSEFDVLEAENPQIALDLFNEHRYQVDCVISDYFMPIEDGASLCQIIKRDNPGVKVILFTGNRSVEKQLTGQERINVILYKPEGLDQIVKHIKAI